MPPNSANPNHIHRDTVIANASIDDDGVVLGPDLNATRSPLDKKEYRHVTLPNGLKCVLVCDTVAMRQRKLEGHYDYETDSDDDDDNDDGDGRMSDNDDEDVSDDNDASACDKSETDGLRKAATALSVNVGSYHDPPHLQGLAHFLEHMLFLGTESHPGDNEYDAFLSRHGGDDNAFTDMEYTCYHYCIPQDGSDGETNVWKALEMFSSFFVCPLLGGEQAQREVNAVESEFELNKSDDDNRLGQVMCYTCGMDGNAPIMGRDFTSGSSSSTGSSAERDDNRDSGKPFHPFAKFAWGNEQSLKIEPEANGIDVMKELRDFYNTHYYAKNMRLVVMAGYELDEIQRRVVKHFRNVPSEPRLPSPTYDTRNERRCITNLHPYKLPFHPSSLRKIYRIVPVKDRHTLTLTWQIPSMCPHWRTKPADYIGHLLGHEASGSILSCLKRNGWAMGCSAGIGEDGESDASTHALFSFQVSLSKAGIGSWETVVGVVFAYIGLLRHHFQMGYTNDEGNKVKGLPTWIYNELKSIAALSYAYEDEGDVTDIVEDLSGAMCPWWNLPDERLLDGDSLLFGDTIDNAVVEDLLFNYITPDNTRVDLMSSFFGRDGDAEPINESNNAANPEFCDIQQSFNMAEAGVPMIEPRFGTKFYVEPISDNILQRWRDAAEPQLPSTDLLLNLPPQNPFIPSNMDLKPLPEDDAAHPLLNCSVKVCITIGKKKSWFPAVVTQYKVQKNNSSEAHHLLLSYEDEDEKWHILDCHTDDSSLEQGHEGSFDGGKTKFKVIAVPRHGEGAVLRYGDADHDDDVEDGTAFPPIPPAALPSRLPQIIHDKHGIKVWHLQDRKFKRPVADLRIKVECDGVKDSALKQGCLDLFCRLCGDELVETCYLASTSELGSSISSNDTGFSVRVWGFDDKLFDLARIVLNVITSKDRVELPSGIKSGRFEACLESLLRGYRNSGMKASSFVTTLRLLCLRPSMKSASSKLQAMENIDSKTFSAEMTSMLKRLAIESLYHGNATRGDANTAADIIYQAFARGDHKAIPKKNIAPKSVVKAKQTTECTGIIAPSLDPKEPNTAVELYLQVDKDGLMNRCLVDLIAQILDEPFYADLRTKQQLGYSVSCGARWTYGVIGMSFKVVTSVVSANDLIKRINQFLSHYRSELINMKHETYMENVIALAKNKLEMFDSLEAECDHYWSEISEGRYDFETHREEVRCLRSITKEMLIDAYDRWFVPVCTKGIDRKRRGLVFHVIGSCDGVVSEGRPVMTDSNASLGRQVDDLVAQFHTKNKDTWGRISF